MPTAAKLHYFTSGGHAYDRAPVLLIHGAGGHHLYWPPQVRRIGDQRIFAMDLPGHGQSGGVGRDSIEDYVDELVAFMDAVGLNSAVWIGHSMGGAIALHAALYQPRRVLGLGLVGCGGRMRVDPTLLSYASREAAFPAALKFLGERSFSETFEPRLKTLALQRMTDMRPAVLHGDLVACNRFDETARLGSISVRTLIVFGAHDRMLPPRSAESLHSAIPGSELIVIGNAGHMVMLERPEETARVLGRFAASIDYKPGVSRN